MKAVAIIFSTLDIAVGLTGMVWAYHLEGAVVPGLICSGAMLIGILGAGEVINKKKN